MPHGVDDLLSERPDVIASGRFELSDADMAGVDPERGA